MRNRLFAYAKTKTQISCAVSVFVFKHLAIFFDCTAARFVSDLVRNPEDRFSHNEAQIDFLVEARNCSMPTQAGFYCQFMQGG